MIETDPYETPSLQEVGRGHSVGPGLLFIFTQMHNLETGEVVQEVRPLRENHCLKVGFSQGQRIVTLDGITVVTGREAAAVYHANYLQNPRLPNTIITHVRLLDTGSYHHFITTGKLP